MHALATLYPWKAARPPARPDSQADQQRPRMCVHVHVGIAPDERRPLAWAGGEGGREGRGGPSSQDRTGQDGIGQAAEWMDEVDGWRDGWNRRGGRYLGREPVVGHPLQRRWCGRVPMSLAARLTWSFSGHKSRNRQPLWRHTALPCPALPCCPRAQSGRWLLIPDTAVESPGWQHLTPGIYSILSSTSAPVQLSPGPARMPFFPTDQVASLPRQCATESAWRPTADDSPTANVRSVPHLTRRPPNATSRTHQRTDGGEMRERPTSPSTSAAAAAAPLCAACLHRIEIIRPEGTPAATVTMMPCPILPVGNPDGAAAQRGLPIGAAMNQTVYALNADRASQTTTQREKKKVLALRRRRQPARCRDSVPSSPFSPGAARASAPLAQLPAGGAKNKRPWAVGSLQEAAPWHTQPVPLRRRIRSCSGQTLSSLSSCPVLSRFFPCLLKNLDALPHRRTSVPSATPPPTVTVRRSHPPIVLPHRLATQLRPPSSHATTRLASRQLLPLPLPAPNHRYTVAMGLPGGIITILHAVLAVFLIIELGLTAYVVSITSGSWYGWWFGSSSVNFMLFNSIWTLLVLVYLAVIPRFAERAYHSLVALVLLGVTTIFWFAGSIALAARIGVPDCDHGSACRGIQSAQAAVAFGFFIWVIVTALTVFEGLGFLKGGARADTTRKPGNPPAAGV
ncbi:hypothetical protein Purlil1_9598 [Purpureocillium lilacinum]|uniref:MARVEL domain-containing protein n=1 Tax=Purpureocillium lilacinum TaxID=33203 RepID=A0ABR0BPU9_PURLI|nr:hypothetical protein Purlil1_9598 [Purpureocillium lilacinum]